MNIGPIVVDWFVPTLSVDATPAGKGLDSVTIEGTAAYPVVHSMRELIKNYQARQTIGGVTGILEYVEMECASLASWDGWYLLLGISMSTDRLRIEAAESDDPTLGQGTTATVPFSITAAYLGDM